LRLVLEFIDSLQDVLLYAGLVFSKTIKSTTMKPILFRIIIINWLIILFVHSALSQEIIDTSTIWRIETTDGNEFFGTILSKDTISIHLNTKMLGVLTIPNCYINSCTPIDQEAIKQGEVWMRNLQAARYFYSPNGFGMEKGSGYYQNTWVLFNQASYGITNYFTLGVGMMPLFLFGGAATPVWITPKFSIPVVKEKLNVGGGVLLGEIVGKDMITFGITYAVATLGNHDRNVTAGMGYAFSDSGWSKPVVDLCGMMRVGKKSYLLTENYFFSMKREDITAGKKNIFVISVGGRTVWPKLSLDYGLVSPINMSDVFVAIPWLGLTLPLGKSKSFKN
jgi:hypothetical protein